MDENLQDRSAVFEDCLARAESGDVIAMAQLGDLYYFGEDVDQNFSEAIKWFAKGACEGDPYCQYSAALLYEELFENPEYAFGLYQLSADQGYPDAQVRLGGIYRKGWEHIEANPGKARFWYTQAAVQDDQEANYIIGMGFLHGDELVVQDIGRAVGCLEKAAKAGHFEAQYEIGHLYHTKKHYAKAVERYEKAARGGHIKAQMALGDMFANGDGVTKNQETAEHWYQMAEKQKGRENESEG